MRVKESYIEHYYKGSRWVSTLRRLTGSISPRSSPKPLFNIVKTLNSPKNTKGILSFTLFGDDNKKDFWSGLVSPLLLNAKLIDKILPGWTIRVYISSSISQPVHDALIKAGCELMVMNEEKDNAFSGLLWRFLPAGESLPFMVCDADLSIAGSNFFIPGFERIDEWLKSDKPFYRRKCFPINIAWPISAGCWGGKPTKDGKPPVPNIKEILEKYDYNWFGSDEAFLRKEVWPLFKKEGYYTVYTTLERVMGVLLIIFILVLVTVIIYKIVKRRR